MQFLATLKALLSPSGRSKAPTASVIKKALAEARAEREAATIEISKLQASRLLALLDPAERAKHSAALAAARQRADDAALAAEELERRLAEAEAAESEAERRRRYDDARARRDALVRAFEPRYREHIEGLLALTRETAEVDAEIDRVNDSLPEGVDALPYVEAIRDRPGLPRKVKSTKVVELWTAPGGDQPISDEMQTRVKRAREARNDGQIWGFANHVNKAIGHHSTSHYVLKQFERIEYLPSTIGESGPRLREFPLPNLHVDEPALYEPRRFTTEPRDILDALDRAAAQPVDPPEQERREKRIEFRLISDEPPAALPERSVPPSLRVPDFGQSVS